MYIWIVAVIYNLINKIDEIKYHIKIKNQSKIKSNNYWYMYYIITDHNYDWYTKFLISLKMHWLCSWAQLHSWPWLRWCSLPFCVDSHQEKTNAGIEVVFDKKELYLQKQPKMGDNETKETETANGLKVETNTDPGQYATGSATKTPKSNTPFFENLKTPSTE